MKTVSAWSAIADTIEQLLTQRSVMTMTQTYTLPDGTTVGTPLNWHEIDGIKLPATQTTACIVGHFLKQRPAAIDCSQTPWYDSSCASAYVGTLRVYIPRILYSFTQDELAKALRREASRIMTLRVEFKHQAESSAQRGCKPTDYANILKKPIKQRLVDYHFELKPFAKVPSLFRELTPALLDNPLVLFKYNHCVGLEFECYGRIDSRDLQSVLPLWAQAASDASIRPPVGNLPHEIRVLLKREDAELRLHKLCNIMQNVGLRVNKSCGLHVHLDARGIGEQAALKNARIMDSWLFHLQELVPPSRRNNQYCQFGVTLARGQRYRAVNLQSLASHQTIEVRLGSATLDYTKVLAWIRLLELLRAMRSKPKAGSCIAVLEQLPMANHDRAYWRARHRQLNPAQYPEIAADTTTDNE